MKGQNRAQKSIKRGNIYIYKKKIGGTNLDQNGPNLAAKLGFS